MKKETKKSPSVSTVVGMSTAESMKEEVMAIGTSF